MKVKVLSRAPRDFTRGTARELHKTHRNRDPSLHPLEKAREYKRALNAAKLDRVFAKPFVAALTRHEDAVSCLALCPSSLVTMVSGGWDGQVLGWDIARRVPLWSVPKAHAGAINGISFNRAGTHFLTCSHDKTVKLFTIDNPGMSERRAVAGQYGSDGEESDGEAELEQWMGRNAFLGVDFHASEPKFATCGAKLSIWDITQTAPSASYNWGTETIKSLAYSPSEHHLLASTGSDNSVCLYDTRIGSPIQKLILSNRANKLAWNPQEPINFTVANEDSNLYTFDMRKLKFASCVHRDHVSAVVDVSYSPTGLEFVTAGYDMTVRIFTQQGARSREVYHTRRMGKVLAAAFTGDARYVVSGSDDHNLRIWKANASQPIRKVSGQEKRKLDYMDKLKSRYQNVPEISKILRHRHVPRKIMKMKQREDAIEATAKRKETNRRAHSKPGAVPHTSERAKHIANVIE